MKCPACAPSQLADLETEESGLLRCPVCNLTFTPEGAEIANKPPTPEQAEKAGLPKAEEFHSPEELKAMNNRPPEAIDTPAI